MLPFSKIACSQCRLFAIRSFASAAAAASPSVASTSNPSKSPQASSSNSNSETNIDSVIHASKSVSTSRSAKGKKANPKSNRSVSKQPVVSSLTSFLLAQRKKISEEAANATSSSVSTVPDTIAAPPSAPAPELPDLPTLPKKKPSGYRRQLKAHRGRLAARRSLTAAQLQKQRNSTTNLPGKDAKTIIIQHVPGEPQTSRFATLQENPSARGRSTRFMQQDASSTSKISLNDGLKPTSESGFTINAEAPLHHSSEASLRAIAMSSGGLDESLKALFARYLQADLDEAAKSEVLSEIAMQLERRKNTVGVSEEVRDTEHSSTAEEEDLLEFVDLAWAEEPVVKSNETIMVAPDIKIETVTPLRDAEVATLAHGLQRVLFNPGIHWLQHPRTGFYNYTQAIQTVADREDFDFGRLPRFIRPSQDADLRELLKQSGRKFAGSTSSLTSAMSQIYFALNGMKQLNTQLPNFVSQPRRFSPGARRPASIVLRLTDEGTYLVDADKSIEEEHGPSENVLSELGHVLERQLTMEPREFSRFLKSSPEPFEPHEMRDKREAYYYSASKNLVMRSQLDCHDDRLPRRTFDIKTRATVAIRMDRLNHMMNRGYLISKGVGELESFEREKYDLIRSAFLKYSMQVRIGNMDGIFLAYHSTGQIFGFEYLSLEDIDIAISGSHEESNQAFHLCVGLLENIFERAIADYPNQTIRLHLNGDKPGRLDVFAEPFTESSLSSNEKEAAAVTAAAETVVAAEAENEHQEDGSEEQAGAAEESKITTAFPSRPDPMRLYTFNITNYLNGKEVVTGSPVDFASYETSLLASSSPSSSSTASQQPDLDTTPKRSAFARFVSTLDEELGTPTSEEEVDVLAELGIDGKEEEGSTESSSAAVPTDSLTGEEKEKPVVWSIKYSVKAATTREDRSIVKAYDSLIKTQRAFEKTELLPEGIPMSQVAELTGKAWVDKKLSSMPASGPIAPEGEEAADQHVTETKDTIAVGDEAATEEPNNTAGVSTTDVAPAHEKTRRTKEVFHGHARYGFITKFKPRHGVKYRLHPTELVKQIRLLAAQGRKKMALASKAYGKKK